QTLEAGQRVLAAVQAAAEFVAGQKLRAAGTLTYLIRQFAFPERDPAVGALSRVAAEWERKPFIATKSLPALLEYLDLYQEGGGMIPLLSEEEVAEAEEESPDAVRLMTVHAPRGLEFSRVRTRRVIARGFPPWSREPLFEFPQSLRSSIVFGDSKEVNEQEERRLFSVAIPRARARLAIHSRHGRGQDRTPPG